MALEKNLKVNDLFSVKDKVIFLTGGGGIGEYLVEAYLANGATVIATNRTREKGEMLAQRMKEAGYEKIRTYAMDQTKTEEIEKVVDLILTEFGRIDVLLNAVGYSYDCKAEDFPETEIQKMININYVSAAMLSETVAKKAMIPAGGGKIINIGSIAGIMCHSKNVFPYEASKAALHQMTKSLALIWAKYNIYVNCIAPTWVKTPLTEHYKGDYFERVRKMHYFDRLSELQDYVGPALFLSSDASSYVSGLILTVDGAWTCGRTVGHEEGYEVQF